MPSPLIGLIGRKRVGKDTVAARLVEKHGFRRFAFADAVRQAALDLDPIVGLSDEYEDVGMYTFPSLRLAEIVAVDGWETAKEHPEVRRTLKRLGSESIRKLDPGFWLRHVFRQIEASAGESVVITDVRFANEYAAVSYRRGGTLWRVTRPGLDESDTHPSETELATYPADAEIANNSTIDDLHAQVDALVASL